MSTEKKRFITFILMAYGVTILMGIVMYIGYRDGLALSCFPNAQMMYPAAGVACGFLFFRKKEEKIPRAFMISIVATTAVMILVAILSVVCPLEPIKLPEAEIDVYYLLCNYILILGSIAMWICYFVAGRERREAVGLGRHNWGKSVLMVLLFLGLYIVRIVLSTLIAGIRDHVGLQGFEELLAVYKDPLVWGTIIALPLNYILVLIAFLGEEYGWRYYLQGVLQQKFGKRAGVILLGIVWGLWHLPIDLMYYTKDSGVQMLIGQIITCVSIAIFFGYAYLKTNNIWVVVCMHFLNNNLIPIITGDLSGQVIENQHVRWSDLVIMLLVDLVVFCLFIFTGEYKADQRKEGTGSSDRSLTGAKESY